MKAIWSLCEHVVEIEDGEVFVRGYKVLYTSSAPETLKQAQENLALVDINYSGAGAPFAFEGVRPVNFYCCWTEKKIPDWTKATVFTSAISAGIKVTFV